MQQKIADLCGKICETLLKAMKVKTNQLRDSPSMIKIHNMIKMSVFLKLT